VVPLGCISAGGAFRERPGEDVSITPKPAGV
jgi:hypothetical protein